MSDPVSSGVTAGAALTGASIFGLLTGTDYGVVFGAFAGATFYVASAADLPLLRRSAYFVVSFIVGVIGAGLAGSTLATITRYQEKPLDALGAVILSAITVKVLTWISEQDTAKLFQRWRGGENGSK